MEGQALGRVVQRLGLAFALAVAGCTKRTEDPAEGLRSTLAKASVPVGPWSPTDARRFSAVRCESTTVGPLEAIACVYGSLEAAELGRHGLERWIGRSATGIVLSHGNALLALADRRQADPSGAIIEAVARTFAPR